MAVAAVRVNNTVQHAALQQQFHNTCSGRLVYICNTFRFSSVRALQLTKGRDSEQACIGLT